VPRNYLAYCNLGIDLADRGRLDDAIDYYRKSLDIKPAYDLAHNNLGIHSGRPRTGLTKRLAIIKKVLEINPDSAENPLQLRFSFWRAADRSTRPLPITKTALEIKPDYIEAHNNLGLALAGRGQIDEAIGPLQNGPGNQAQQP